MERVKWGGARRLSTVGLMSPDRFCKLSVSIATNI